MKVDMRYLLLSGVGIILIVSAMITPSMVVEKRTALDGEPVGMTTIASMAPGNVTIEGTIIDSCVDVLYTVCFDNSASSTATEIDWLFELQEGIRLSNVSIDLGNVTYWGRVMPVQEAIEEYNESVEQNESALLVVRTPIGYRIDFNLENGTEAIVSVRVEGLLTRKLGLYSLDLPIAQGVPIHSDVYIDLSIRSNFESIAGYSIRGLPSFTATDLVNGVRIQYASATPIDFDVLEIRYSLNRQLGGSQLLTYTNGTDNFFVYLLAPSIVEVSEIESRQYVFVLDKSGSMSGTKIVQAKAAFNSMIELLQPNDLFNVVAFDSNVLTLWVEPHSASVASIEDAQNWVSSTNAGGSTNFHGAMMTSLDMMISGDNVKAILMLSDGQPTAGEITSSSGILSAVEEANDMGVSISTVAFGSDSDENLMANLAAQNDGFFVFIQPDEEAAARLVEFYSEFATPIADSYSIEFEGVLDMSIMKPLDNSPFFNGSEILVCGRYESSMNVSTSIDYPGGTETYTNSATTPSTENEHIEKLWAQHRITYLLRVVQLEGETQSLRDEIINLGMQYGIIVEGYTALLITTDYLPGETTTDSDNGRLATATWTTTTTTTTTGAPPAFSAILPITGFAVGTLVIVGLISIVIWRRRT